MGSCYVCGSADIAAGADPRNPTCPADLPARAHPVSMRRDEASGDSLAICSCGWSNRVAWLGSGAVQDRAVRLHWLGQRTAAPSGATAP